MSKTKMSLESFKARFKVNVNEQQEKAMCRVDGPTLLLAVPGSGKTTVIVARTGYMIHCAGIDSDRILNLTFSNAAAEEMKRRFHNIYGDGHKPKFSTIHSFCTRVALYCKDKYGVYVPEIEAKNERIIRRAIMDLGPENYPSTNIVKDIQSGITLVKNLMLSDAEAALETANLNCLGMLGFDFMTIYKAYEEDKINHKIMDFDDLLTMAYDLLTEYPEALEHFQNQYTHISIDEAQDTSKIQHEIIRMLASKNRNLFMVGDDDQSIYRFRGAAPTYLLEFEHIYPEASILYMDINYRSDKSIIKQADQFIQDNKERFPKKLSAISDDDGQIDVITVPDMVDQYERLY
ncbi:MAG: ATP-dependent helicase, partial [Clostridiales bacterium]|nr:ATP-dependent helicase [Clostridiales bacterium]